MKFFNRFFVFSLVVILLSCIKNDIPYPIVEGQILAFEVKGQTSAPAKIYTAERRVEVEVEPDVDLTKIEVTTLQVTEGATVVPSKEEIQDFSRSVVYTVTTYQDYLWEVFVQHKVIKGEFTQFEVEGQLSSEIIPSENTIKVTMPEGTDLSNLNVLSYEVSPEGTTVNPDPKITKDFSQPVAFTLTPIEGEVGEWSVEVWIEGDQPEGSQILYSDFSTWFKKYDDNSPGDESKTYMLPGMYLDETPWRSSDKGSAEVSIPVFRNTVSPQPNMEQAEYALLETKTAMLGILASGSLFVGEIEGSGISDVNMNFGIPFTDKPVGFKTSFTYKPTEYRNGGQTYMDECDIYVLLQVREGEGANEKRYRLATGWYRSSDEIVDWKDLNMPLTYGESSELADYMRPKPDDQYLPEAGFYHDKNATPTHIVVVYASSAQGSYFIGGVGSQMKVKGFELLY
ncbi:PCMD domain-containing protein [Aureibacter tunicatorum]|uniref:Putative carbohydrate metabolism domain-containing protein n=1 Tax=Aureibacter tunicatorum TaxID=866807 RepID=A0AAE3XP29_9BACT|nr:PCMD domain-containing protein [Aureibacter tunicatorum]MDR6239444.1 hypothetical protein [Aureibacter tunicatorum]BDD04633.1 hypothetical protein AUTU_21160 [Aureibacter tunicatorum]